MNNTALTQEDLSTLFGLDELSEEEKADMLEDIGTTLVEGTLLRFMMEADEATATKAESFIEDENSDNPFEKLLLEFPRFGEILEEEIAAFKREAAAVLA